MPYSTEVLPALIKAVDEIIANNAEQVTALDKAIGDGDHVTNLQRGIKALGQQSDELIGLEWDQAFKKTGMLLMSTVGGASGSLYATLFLAMSKAANQKVIDLKGFSEVYSVGVVAMKQRGKADLGEKTMLDVLIPVAESLHECVSESQNLDKVLAMLPNVAQTGMESTRDMLATKGRASFLGERTRGCIDAGARSAQLMICAMIEVLQQQSATPSQ